MLQLATLLLPWCATAGLAAIGIAAVAAPRFLSKKYGVPVSSEPELAWVRAAGIRDVVLAIVLGVSLWGTAYELTAALCGFVGAIAFFDFTFAAIANGQKKVVPASLIHLAGGLVFIACFLLLMAKHLAAST